jgi:hypothetical protein
MIKIKFNLIILMQLINKTPFARRESQAYLHSVAKFNADLDSTFDVGGKFAVTKKANADSIEIIQDQVG